MQGKHDIILHRGNTKLGPENSKYAIEIDEETRNKFKNIILEVDVYLKEPFVVLHNVHNKVSENFDI